MGGRKNEEIVEWSAKHVRAKYLMFSTSLLFLAISYLTVEKISILGLVVFTEKPEAVVLWLSGLIASVFFTVSFWIRSGVENAGARLTTAKPISDQTLGMLQRVEKSLSKFKEEMDSRIKPDFSSEQEVLLALDEIIDELRKTSEKIEFKLESFSEFKPEEMSQALRSLQKFTSNKNNKLQLSQELLEHLSGTSFNRGAEFFYEFVDLSIKIGDVGQHVSKLEVIHSNYIQAVESIKSFYADEATEAVKPLQQEFSTLEGKLKRVLKQLNRQNFLHGFEREWLSYKIPTIAAGAMIFLGFLRGLAELKLNEIAGI